MKDYWGAYMKQVRDLDFEKEKTSIMRLSKAPLEHCFNNHEYCKKTWCYKLQADEKGLIYRPPPNRPFYNKETAQCISKLSDCLATFNTEESIRESMHPYDTQLNESLNQSIGQICPKF